MTCRFCAAPLEADVRRPRHVAAGQLATSRPSRRNRDGAVLSAARAGLLDAASSCSSRSTSRRTSIFSDYAYFSSYSTLVAGALARATSRRWSSASASDGSSQRGRGRLQRRLSPAVLQGARHPRARDRARGQRGRGRGRRRGMPTLVEFFGVETARSSPPSRRADLLLGNNVLAHVPDINDFVGGMKVLLKPGGVITMEFPHLMRLIDENQWDTIYHEHFSYFSFTTARRVFAAHGLRLFDVEEMPTHGGSLRIYRLPRRRRRQAGHRARRASCSAREDAAGYSTRRDLPRLRRARVAEDKRDDPRTADRAQARRAGGSSATARRRRATRCSTTAAIGTRLPRLHRAT